MTAATITLPGNIKVRTQSRRRYILVNVWQGKATVHKRSDNYATIRSERNKHYNRPDSTWYVIDTTTGERI